jgi:hypothetical protein
MLGTVTPPSLMPLLSSSTTPSVFGVLSLVVAYRETPNVCSAAAHLTGATLLLTALLHVPEVPGSNLSCKIVF